MKVLIICREKKGIISPFVLEQVNALKVKGVKIEYSCVKKAGLFGYFIAVFQTRKIIKNFKPDFLHAHYGLCGLVALFQFKPFFITFHGTDVNAKLLRMISKFVAVFSRGNIVVSEELKTKLNSSKTIVIPCGVDLHVFQPLDKKISREKLGLPPTGKIILFGASLSVSIKNPDLALETMRKYEGQDVKLLDLDGFSREQVALMINAADVVLLTSKYEGSPQIIKEAMACNTPIVSTKCGDVAIRLKHIDGCFLVDFNSDSVFNALNESFKFSKTESRDKIQHLENSFIADSIIDFYKQRISCAE